MSDNEKEISEPNNSFYEFLMRTISSCTESCDKCNKNCKNNQVENGQEKENT